MAKIPSYPKINYLDASESFILTTTSGTYQTDSSVIAGAHERLYNHDDYIDSTEMSVIEQRLDGDIAQVASDLTANISTLTQALADNAIDSTNYADAVGSEAAANAANEASNAVGAHLSSIDHSQFLTVDTVPRTLITDVYYVNSLAERDLLIISDGTTDGVWVGDVVIVNDGTQNDSFIFDGSFYRDLGYNNSVQVHESAYNHDSFITLADSTQAIIDYGAITAEDATAIHETLKIESYATVLAADFENANSLIGDFPVGFSTMQVADASWPTSNDGVVVTSKPSNVAGEQTFIDESQQIYKRSWISQGGFIDPNDDFSSLNQWRWYMEDGSIINNTLNLNSPIFGGGLLGSYFQYDTNFDFKIDINFASMWHEQALGTNTTMFEIGVQDGTDIGAFNGNAALFFNYENSSTNAVRVGFASNPIQATGRTLATSAAAGVNMDGTAVLEWFSSSKTLSGYYIFTNEPGTIYGLGTEQFLTMPRYVNFWFGEGGGRALAEVRIDSYYTAPFSVTIPQNIEEWGPWQELATIADLAQTAADATAYANALTPDLADATNYTNSQISINAVDSTNYTDNIAAQLAADATAYTDANGGGVSRTVLDTTATAGQTIFTTIAPTTDIDLIDVWVIGIKLVRNEDYTISGANQITISSPTLSLGDNVEIIIWG